METRLTRILLRCFTGLVFAFLYLPLVVIGLFAFNASRIQAWPITSWSTQWWSVAWNDGEVRDALANSIKVALISTSLALILGTLAAFAMARYRFFGRSVVSLAFVLPLALPGIVTGVALKQTFLNVGLDFGLATIIVGHATFCIVIVFNNAVARLRRSSVSMGEASQDLGASGWQTFWYVTLPNIRSALLAGALLAFALSFDEIVVTHFTAGAESTLPTWVLDNLGRAQARPKVNVVAFVVILASIIPVYFAQRITADDGTAGATKG